MKRALQGMAVGLVAWIVLATVGARAGIVALPELRPAGHGFWLVSRAMGVAAYAALSLEVLLGLSLTTAASAPLVAKVRVAELHRWLSPAGLILAAAHGLALLGDRYAAFDVLDVTVPFLAPYRSFAVGLGILAFYGAAVTHASFGLKGASPRVRRALHGLSFAAFLGATPSRSRRRSCCG